MNSEVFSRLKLDFLREQVLAAKTIVVTTHKNPDGDAMGASLGWLHFLKKWGADAVLIVPNEYPEFLHFLPGNDEVIVFERDRKAAEELINHCDLIFAMDYNEFSRTGEMEKPLSDSGAVKIMIDHHQNPQPGMDCLFSDTSSCATAELVYLLIEAIEAEKMIDKDIATCLYTGIVTDTGSFRFPSTSAKTHRIAAALIDRGVRNGEVHRELNDNNTESVLKMRGHVLSNNLVVMREFGTAYISLNMKEQATFETKPGDTEGLVNEALSIKGVVMAAFFKEDYKLIKISFRSLGSFPVNQLASKHFGGGGHINAAGGFSKESLEATVQRFISVLPEYKKLLDEAL